MPGTKGKSGGNHGGGRKPVGERRKERVSISLSPELTEQLPSNPMRSAWIEQAIREKLERENADQNAFLFGFGITQTNQEEILREP